MRLFTFFYPKHLVVLTDGEGIIVWASFVLAVLIRRGPMRFARVSGQSLSRRLPKGT
jgi:hypothetical protein